MESPNYLTLKQVGSLTSVKAESALMYIEAFDGIVKFNQKNAIASVTGHITSLESCDIIKKGDLDYKSAATSIISAQKEFAQIVSDTTQKEIQELENKLSDI